MSECLEPEAYKGECCCNCRYQCKIVIDREHFSYGCGLFFALHSVEGRKGYQEPGSVGKIVQGDEHGVCEMHAPVPQIEEK